MISPRRGEVWFADLDPTEGHEQAGRRPVLVLSVDSFNSGPGGLVTVLPMTSKARALSSRVAIVPPEAGVTSPSYVIGEQIRTITVGRFGRRVGAVSRPTLDKVADIVRMLLGL